MFVKSDDSDVCIYIVIKIRFFKVIDDIDTLSEDHIISVGLSLIISK